MASHRARAGSGWILDVKSPKEWQCNGTAAQGVERSPSLEVSEDRGDVALRAAVSGHGVMGWGCWAWGS